MTIAPQTVLSDHTILPEPPPCPDPRGPDGVLSISADRWATAQRYEAHCWMSKYRHMGDDREAWHAAHFDGYRALAGKHFHRAIEVGCGPFTQVRRILRGSVVVDEITLLDPLLDQYAQLPKCSHDYLARGRKLTRLALPIEELPLQPEGFDLVVSINVLQHCRDYQQSIDAIRGLAASGATLVLHESGIARGQLDEFLAQCWDAGHPIQVADDRLARDIEAMGRVIYHRIAQRHEAPWARELYYILEAK